MSIVSAVSAPTRVLASSGWPSRALFGLAALAAAASLAWPVTVEPPSAASEPRAPAADPARGAALARPLFDPGRQAWTARGTRASVLEGDPPRPVLSVRGILLDGGSARALIDDGSGVQTWLTRGQARGDWRVTAIEPDRVSIDQNGRSYTATFLGPSVTLRPATRPLPAEAGPQLRR